MTDSATALATVLGAERRFALVTGRHLDGLEPLVSAAAVHVKAPGPTTRLQVAAGLQSAGHPVVAVLEDLPPGPAPDGGVIAVTSVAACARAALLAGWTVVQPWAAGDIEPLVTGAAEPTLVLLGGEPALEFTDPPAPRRTRLWLDGDLATLVASGVGVPPAVRLAERLQERGVDIAAVEVAVLNTPAQAPLVGGEGLLVAGRDTVAAFRGTSWPDVPSESVALAGVEEADLIGAVLAAIRTA